MRSLTSWDSQPHRAVSNPLLSSPTCSEDGGTPRIFFGVRLVLTRGVATATYNGPMSGAAESVKAIVQFCKAE